MADMADPTDSKETAELESSSSQIPVENKRAGPRIRLNKLIADSGVAARRLATPLSAMSLFRRMRGPARLFSTGICEEEDSSSAVSFESVGSAMSAIIFADLLPRESEVCHRQKPARARPRPGSKPERL